MFEKVSRTGGFVNLQNCPWTLQRSFFIPKPIFECFYLRLELLLPP
jgi:hypothetical protein